MNGKQKIKDIASQQDEKLTIPFTQDIEDALIPRISRRCQGIELNSGNELIIIAVSYTHLTLPTIYSV